MHLYLPRIPRIMILKWIQSENIIGSPNPTNEVSENISDAKNTGVLDDAEMLQKDSNTLFDKNIHKNYPPIDYHDKNESNKNTQSINTSSSSHSSDESNTFSSSRINKSPNVISKTNLSKQSNEDNIENLDLQNDPGPLINEYNLEKKAKLHDSNLKRSENPNEVE